MRNTWLMVAALAGLCACAKSDEGKAAKDEGGSPKAAEESRERAAAATKAEREVTFTRLAHQLSGMMPNSQDATVDLEAVKAVMSQQLSDPTLWLAYTIDFYGRPLTYCWRGPDGACDDTLYKESFGVPAYVDDGSWTLAMEALKERADEASSDPRLILDVDVRDKPLQVFVHPIHAPDIKFLPAMLVNGRSSDPNFKGWVVLGYERGK